MTLQIEAIATYFVDKRNNRFDDTSAEKNVGTLPLEVSTFLLKLVEFFWEEEEKKYITSGFFTDETDQEIGVSIAKPYINGILAGTGTFAVHTRNLASHLYQISPRTAAPGLLTILKLYDQTNDVHYVCILKIRYKDESLVKIPNDALTQITVELIENVLLSDVQKGAIIPHPIKADYELKVTDNVGDDPAQYFTGAFLGCKTKKSDVHQIKNLIPELEELGREKGIRINTEKLPAVIASLQEKEVDVTPDVLAEVASEEGLYESNIDSVAFDNHFRDDVGDSLDIPAASFSSKGKRRTPRAVTIKFVGGEYNGITINGNVQTLKNIIQVEGDRAVLHIETTRDGIRITYE